jgi:NhaP-type Na+/H+ or K+/H+ antiporter
VRFLNQVLQLSGIVALFFSGICHAHYSYYSVAHDAQITLRRFFQFAAFLSETFVFAYLGLQVASCLNISAQHCVCTVSASDQPIFTLLVRCVLMVQS